MIKSWLLDACMDLAYSHDESTVAVYQLSFEFTDLLGRERKYKDLVAFRRPVSRKKRLELQKRISFTAMSSVDVMVGMVESVTPSHIFVRLLNESIVRVDNRLDFECATGDVVTLVERCGTGSSGGRMQLFAIPNELGLTAEDLRLQAVNADILDGSGQLVYRLSMDPISVRGQHDTHLAT